MYWYSKYNIRFVFAQDAHTREDVDYQWKEGKSKGVEIVSTEMAQFDFDGASTYTKANTNSKGSMTN